MFGELLEIMENMNKTFYFSNPELPTPFNLAKHLLDLGYRQAQPGLINDKHFHLDPAHSQLLEYKHLLAQLSQQYCPEVMPLTLLIDDHNYPEVLRSAGQIMQQCDSKMVWILKPSMLNNGEQIHLFDSMEKLKNHYASNNRLGGPHVLQRYILDPHLLQGHKYTLRMFVVLSNVAGAFIYQHGYFNIARTEYTNQDFNHTSCHLTNEHLASEQNPNNWQVPTERTPHFDNIYPSLVQIATRIIQALRMEAPPLFDAKDQYPAFGIFGFDYLLDASLRPWLLEVNHGPCFPCDPNHPLQNYLYQPFWLDLITHIIEPALGISTQDSNKTDSCFESIDLG